MKRIFIIFMVIFMSLSLLYAEGLCLKGNLIDEDETYFEEDETCTGTESASSYKVEESTLISDQKRCSDKSGNIAGSSSCSSYDSLYSSYYVEKGHPNDYWTELNNGLSSWNIAGIAVDHQDPSIVFILTQFDGVYKSTDGGNTWVRKGNGLPENPTVTWGHTHGDLLTMDPCDSSILYISINGQPYRTLDGAQTWDNINNGIEVCAPDYQVAGILIDPQDSNHIFAGHQASGCSGGIFESFDRGDSWTQVAGWGMGSGAMTNDAWALDIDPTNASRMYCAPAYLGFLYSEDGGHYWIQSRPEGAGGSGATVTVHPTVTNRILFGHGYGLYRSEDYGLTWTDMTDNVGQIIHDIKFAPSDPNIGYTVGLGGLFKTEDAGLTWTEIGDYDEKAFRTIAVHPTDPDIIYLASGCSGVFRSTDGGLSITGINQGLPTTINVRTVAIASSNPNIYYAVVLNRGFYRSEDRGETWTLVSTHPGVTDTADLEVTNKDPDILFAGYHRLYKSTDGGHIWNVTLDSGQEEYFEDIEIDPYDDSIVYATSMRYFVNYPPASPSAFFKSTDGGETWDVKENFAIITRQVKPIVVDPTDTNRIYVGTYSGLRKSEDGGETWRTILNGLTSANSRMIDGLAVKPKIPNEMYLSARDYQIYQSTDYGESWMPYMVLSQFFDGSPGKILVDNQNGEDLYITAILAWYKSSDEIWKEKLPTTGLTSNYYGFMRSLLQDPLDPERFISGDVAQGVVVYNRYKDLAIFTDFPSKLFYGETLDLSGTIRNGYTRQMLNFNGIAEILIKDGETIIKNDTVEVSTGQYTMRYEIDNSFGDFGRKDLMIYVYNKDTYEDAVIITQFAIDDPNNPHSAPVVTELTYKEIVLWDVCYGAFVSWQDAEKDDAKILICETPDIQGFACQDITYCESDFIPYDSSSNPYLPDCEYRTNSDKGQRYHTKYVFLCDEFECIGPERMDYVLNHGPTLKQEIPNINLLGPGDVKTIDLSEYFYDKDGDELTYNYYDNTNYFINATVNIDGSMVTISLAEDSPRARAKFYASDSFQTTYSGEIVINFIPKNLGVEIAYDIDNNMVLAGDFGYYDENGDKERGSVIDLYKNGEFLFSKNQSTQTCLVHFEGDAVNTDGDDVRYHGDISYTNGKFGQGIHFGTEAWVFYDTDDALDLKEGTIEFWVNKDTNWDDISEEIWLVYFSSEWAEELFVIWDPVTKALKLHVKTGSELNEVSIDTSDWLADEWHHITAAWDLDEEYENNLIKLYADNRYAEDFGVDPFRALMYENWIFFGHKGYAMDELRISNKVLDDTEITYNKTRNTPFYQNEVILEGDYYDTNDIISVKYCPSDSISIGRCIDANVLITDMPLVDVEMELPKGWSMISLPVRPDVTAVQTLFPEAVVIYRYQKGTGYVRLTEGENLEVGVGYWILLDTPQLYVIRGTVITEYTIQVDDGWYMIGGCTFPARKDISKGEIAVIYNYTQDNGYTRILESEPLASKKGYWILFSNTLEGAEFTARKGDATVVEKGDGLKAPVKAGKW